MASESGIIHPLFSLRGTRGKKLLTVLLYMLVCTLGFHTGASAFTPGGHRPPGVPDMNHPDTKLIVTKTNSIANSGEENIVTAHVVDEFGVPVQGAIVSFANSIFGQNRPTDASGNATFEFAGFSIGQANVTATVGGIPFKFGDPSYPAVTNFIAGPPATNVPTTTVFVFDDNAVANGVEKNIIRAHMTDAYGNPVAFQTIAFTIQSGTASIVGFSSIQTDANGNADLQLISLVAGQVTVSATWNSIALNNSPVQATFVADVPQTSNPATALSVVTNNAIANNTATNSVKAHIVDANGNPVSGAIIAFTITSGTATFTIPNPIITDVNGDAIITLKSGVAGNVNITATVNGTPIVNGSPAKVTFVAGPPAVNVSGTALIVVTNNALANGTATNTVRARIKDANGNAVGGATIVFSIISGTGTIVGSGTVITSALGNATINLTSTVAGNVSIVATVNGIPIVFGSPAIVTFVADAPQTSNPATLLSVVDDNRTANNAALNSVKAHIVDANGNPVPNASIVFTITGGTATFDDTNPILTDANGDAIMHLKSGVAGTVTITATVNGIPITNGSPVTVTFVAGAPSVTNPSTTLIVVDNNALANGTATNSVRARIKDANGNPVAGATIVFTIVSGTGTIVGSGTVTTSALGNASINLTSTVAGDVSITATVNGIPIVFGSPAIVTFVADAPQTSNPATLLSVVDDNRVANNAALNSVKAHIVDANGNPVPNATIVFTITGGTATFDDTNPILTDANGDAIMHLKSGVAGTVTITATVNGIPITNGSPVAVTFVADVPAVANPATALSVVLNNALANGSAVNSVKAHIVDANGNPVPNALIKFIRASGTATFTSPPVITTDANGDATVTLSSTVVGSVDIIATVNGIPIVFGSPATVIFVADVPSVANPATALIVVIPTAVANGTAVTSVRAHIVDANGNPVPGASINFTIASGAANIVETNPIITDANGDAIITLNSTIVGSVTITATVNGTPILNGSPAAVAFVVDVPAVANPATALSVVLNNAIANGSAVNSVNAHIEDAQGNPVPNATIVFTITSGTASFVGTATVTTNASGNATITLNSTVAGSVNITATVNGIPIVNGSPATVIFVADAPAVGNPATALIVVVPTAPANDVATTSVKAHIVDANGNPVPGASINFAIASGTATINQTNPIITDANGDAIITLHSSVVGSVNITATVNGTPIPNGSPAIVQFVPDVPAVSNPATALSVVIPSAVANGTAVNSVKAHIVDASGHPVPGATIVFTIASGTATIVETNPIITDANGDAIITLHSTVAGKVNITATVNGIPIVNGSPAIVTFVAGNPDPTNVATALIIVTNNALANGTATNSVKAHIADANGNPVPGATIQFAIANGTASIVETNPIITDVNGDAIITLTSTVVGTVDITATVNSIAIVNGSPATVNFTTEPDVNIADTRLIVLSNNALADGIEVNSVKAHIVDATGTPLGMKDVFFRIESGDATVLTVQPVLTDANGDATILLASKTPGAVSVTAKVGDKNIINGSPAKLRFVPIDIYVPRVFTPNNDGNNDIVKPIVVGITTFHYFNIYNRWGNLVFTTKDPNVGWDGRFKGVLQPVETYLWVAEGLDKDKKKITRRGMISLVR